MVKFQIFLTAPINTSPAISNPNLVAKSFGYYISSYCFGSIGAIWICVSKKTPFPGVSAYILSTYQKRNRSESLILSGYEKNAIVLAPLTAESCNHLGDYFISEILKRDPLHAMKSVV